MSDARRRTERIIHRHSKSFALASKLLPQSVRASAVSIYAWCRRADDAVDLAPPAEQRVALRSLEAELMDVYAGTRQSDPVLSLFQETVRGCRIPVEYPRELLEGLRMDVRGTRYETFEDLLLYCHRVAGVVGLMMCHVMRVRDDVVLTNAAHLGIAMQLTNICRDVAEDWDRGRLYIPREVLARHGSADLADRLGGPFPGEAREAVAEATRELLDEADRYYASGDAGLHALSWRCALSIRTARHVYHAIGTRVRASGCDPLAGRAFVPMQRKLFFVSRSLGEAAVEMPRRALDGGDQPTLPKRVAHFPDDVLSA